MLFGNRDEFALEIDPLSPRWERRYPAEQAAWAALRIWVSGVNLCDHLAQGTNLLQPAVNVPLAPLADWLVRSWLSLRFEEHPRLYSGSETPHENLRLWGEAPPLAGVDEDPWLEARERWWSAHFVLAGAEGSLLPNLALARSHDRLICDWAPPRVAVPDNPLWFRERGVRTVAWSLAEESVTAFAAFVAGWLREEHLGDLYPWARFESPLRDRPTDAMAGLELLTGHSSEDLGRLLGAHGRDELRRALGLPGDDPVASPVTQALRDLPTQLDPSISEPLGWLRSRTEGAISVHMERLRAAAADAARATASDTEGGYEAASAVRRELGLDGEPIPDVMRLCVDAGVQCQEFEAPAIDGYMVTGAREGLGSAAAVLRNDRTAPDWARRFEWARALGHLVLDPFRSGAMGAASSPRCVGYRRRRSGAFAAELLLPRTALVGITGEVLDAAAETRTFENLMRRFGTGATTTAQHLYNRRLLSSPAVRDDLIERHAARA